MKDLGVYIHIPFCRSKCGYCDFVSVSGCEDLFLSYKDVLLKEIKSFDFSCYKIKTVFMGGGTPTVLPPFALEEILSMFQNESPLETTVETNPNTASAETFDALKRSGVTRISIGLQACQDRLLNTLERTHSKEDFLNCFKLAREAGFENINIDLMFSLPGQTIEDLAETLEFVTELKPEHISLYSLTIAEGTRFEVYGEPDEDLDRQMYYMAKKYLSSKKYNQYEISNFALEGFECKHNMSYWDRVDYKGFGAAAHSFLNGVRMHNSNIEQYILKNEIEGKLILSEKDSIEEFMFLGLRKNSGINLADFESQFKHSAYDIYGEKLKSFMRNDFIRQKNGYLFLTDKGMDVSNIIFSEFLL